MARIPRIPRHAGSDFVADAIRRSERPKVRRVPSPRRSYDAALVEAHAVLAAHTNGGVDWATVGPRALVGLFILLHNKVYRVEPEELLTGTALVGAISAAGRLIRDIGQIAWAFDYVRWTWAREAKAFPRRESDWRIDWRYQFCNRKPLTDYRVAMSKPGKVAG